MKPGKLARRIDQTFLKPHARRQDVEVFLRDAEKYPFASVCIPPCYVGLAAKVLGGSSTGVGTVAGFPLGYQARGAKLLEAQCAVDAGASEIDVVMNVSAFRSGEVGLVEDEISEIVSALPGAVVKVIIESCYLTEDEKAAACDMAVRAGARFVKTSTGFAPRGATVEDVRLLAQRAAGRIGVKAAGGIGTLERALLFLNAGAERVGTSSGLDIMEELLERQGL